QLLEGLHIAFADKVAGPLPAEIGARRIAPGRAVIVLIPGEEIEEQAGLRERPYDTVLRAEDAAEQLLGLAPVEEMRLIGRALIGIAGRDGDAVETQLHHRVEEARNARCIGAVEQRAVDVDAEALGLREPDRRDGAVIDAVLAN